MHEPGFWHRPTSLIARCLLPLAALYGRVAAARMAKPGHDAGIPVICVGNYHTGGAGKTPTVLALAAMLRGLGETPWVLSRGYGGAARGPLRVDPVRHRAAEVGDEPLMMAAQVPVVVARDRVAGAALARAGGASVIVMDDGFQNPALRKDLSLIVIDGGRGLGNGLVFPAGPLRAPLLPQLVRTDALLVIGAGRAARPVEAALAARGVPVLHADVVPDPAAVTALRGRRVLAFAGIGHPDRFFALLRAQGIEVARARAFPDHHPLTRQEIAALHEEAARDGLGLVTTEKDMARLRNGDLAALAEAVTPFPVGLRFADETACRTLLTSALRAARPSA